MLVQGSYMFLLRRCFSSLVILRHTSNNASCFYSEDFIHVSEGRSVLLLEILKELTIKCLSNQNQPQEMRVLSKLRSPWTVTMIGAVLDPNFDPVLVMEVS